MRYDNANITEIAGYRLTERIGSGGMGDVYKAYNASLNRTAAVKMLHQKDMADRFRNEAYIQSSVSHPNIACMYEYVVSGNTPCIIMEYVEGEALDSYLHKRGKLSSQQTEQIVKQIASALAYLHKKDILHRDIKPQNFKIQPDGKVTMLDFGIAKNKYTPKLTQLGFVVGTTEYMAPEQFQQQVEKKSDIWSLGVLAYELVTGYLPFEATNPVTLRAKIEKGSFTNPRILVPEVSEKIKTVIEKSLRLSPSARADAAEIVHLLGDDQRSFGRPQTAPVKFTFSKKNIAIAAGALLLIIAIVYFAGRPGESGGTVIKPPPSVKTDQPATEDIQRLTISVPNVDGAYIVFPDGSTQKLPYEISGKEGQNFQFTIKADGYIPRDIEVPVTNRRKAYEYNLEKINQK